MRVFECSAHQLKSLSSHVSGSARWRESYRVAGNRGSSEHPFNLAYRSYTIEKKGICSGPEIRYGLYFLFNFLLASPRLFSPKTKTTADHREKEQSLFILSTESLQHSRASVATPWAPTWCLILVCAVSYSKWCQPLNIRKKKVLPHRHTQTHKQTEE